MPKSQISKNGEVLRNFSDWLDENVESAKRKLKRTKLDRAAKITATQDETKWEAVKYYFKQLHNTNRMAFNTLLEYLAKLANVGLIDNKLLRIAEKKYAELKRNDIKFVEWLKKHPATSSYLSYYFLVAALSLMTWGGIKGGNRGQQDDNDTPKKEIIIEPNDEEIVIEPDGDDDKKKKKDKVVNKVYDLTDKNFMENFVDENWEDVVIGLLELETYRDKPTLQKGEDRYTYGPGITWVYIKDENGVVEQKPCIGDYKKMAEGFSKKQVWGQVRLHLLYKTEVMAKIKNAYISRGITKVSSEQILGLLFAGYQTPAYVDNIISGIVKAGNNKQKQIDAFQYYKGKKKWKTGTIRRRWWCAMYYAGKIDSYDFLELNRDVFSKVSVNLILKNGHFQYDEATILYALGLQNNKSKVRDYIIANKVCSLDGYSIPNVKGRDKLSFTELQINNPSVAEMDAGLAAAKAGDYKKAIEHYKQAIEIDIDNLAAYSDLSIIYKKYGDELLKSNKNQEALNYYDLCCNLVIEANKRMNANKSLLEDLEIKAHTYYNAGQARDAMADIYMAKGDYKKASYEYGRAAKNYETAYLNAAKLEMDSSILDIYLKAKTKSENNKSIAAKKGATIKVKSTTKAKGKKKQAFANAVIKLNKGTYKQLLNPQKDERMA